MKICMKMLLLSALLCLPACTSAPAEDVQVIALQNIQTIQIDHGSTTLHILDSESDKLEASLIMHDDGPGIAWDIDQNRLDISLKSDVARMLNIGEMPELYIRIPAEYDGRLIVEGSSGKVRIQDWNAGELEVRGTSGSIKVNIPEIRNSVKISATSGDVHLTLERSFSNAHWLLESGSGRRSVTFSLEEHEHTNRTTTGRTGDGSHQVHLKTSSGNIKVESQE